jgi:predicted small lipoprotein YifL
MKRLLSVLLTFVMVLSFTACGSKPTQNEETKTEPEQQTSQEETVDNQEVDNQGTEEQLVSEEGEVLNIWTWNTEFWDFLCKYYADETIDEYTCKKGDVTIKRTTFPSDDLAYQNALDEALLAQADAPEDEKVDIFLAEADYIMKYTQSEATMDVTTIGVDDFSNAYDYTVAAASDENGVPKGVSFQCCPSAMIYRRSIAKDVLGTDDPAEVQEFVSDWDKFDEVAAMAKEKDYYMLGTVDATYRVFSNNVSSAWVEDGKLNFDEAINAWMDQAETYMDKGYAHYAADIWSTEATSDMAKDGKALCYFGPAWYFQFSMGTAFDPETGSSGDWAICEGPQAHFWGGTWILAANGTDNPTMVADIMNTFIHDEEVCTKLVEEEGQFVNNKTINDKFAADDSYGYDFLGGQNFVKVFAEMTDNIKFEHQTIYAQACNEKLQAYYRDFLNGQVTKEQAIANFKDAIKTMYPNVDVGA